MATRMPLRRGRERVDHPTAWGDRQGQQWYVRFEDQEAGPDSSGELRRLAAEGSVSPDLLFGLDRQRWIKASHIALHEAININRGRPGREVGRAWKLLGYGGGPLVVDFLAAG